MASEGMHSPVEQFEIRPIIELAAGGYDISFTNSSLFMLLAMVVGGGFLFAAMRNRELVPGRVWEVPCGLPMEAPAPTSF